MSSTSIHLQALVNIWLDGTYYPTGSWITLPASQRARADELIRYGYVREATPRPKSAKKSASSDSA